jgi:hypothetical protein
VRRTNTATVLTPAIVLATVVILAIASILGIAVAGSVFGLRGVHIGGVKAVGLFLLLAVSTLIFCASEADMGDRVVAHHRIHWLACSCHRRK